MSSWYKTAGDSHVVPLFFPRTNSRHPHQVQGYIIQFEIPGGETLSHHSGRCCTGPGYVGGTSWGEYVRVLLSVHVRCSQIYESACETRAFREVVVCRSLLRWLLLASPFSPHAMSRRRFNTDSVADTWWWHHAPTSRLPCSVPIRFFSLTANTSPHYAVTMQFRCWFIGVFVLLSASCFFAFSIVLLL